MGGTVDWGGVLNRSGIAQRLALHQHVLKALRAALPENLRNACQSCWLDEQGNVVIGVEHALLVGQLRFWIPQLQVAARQALNQTEVNVRVRIAEPLRGPAVDPPAAVKKTERPVVTTASVAALKQAACHTPAPEVAAALRRLATTLGDQTSD